MERCEHPSRKACGGRRAALQWLWRNLIAAAILPIHVHCGILGQSGQAMAGHRGKRRVVNSSRPRIPPPAPFWRISEREGAIWGQSILSEHDDSLALLLWRAARAVRLFYDSAEKARARLTHAKWHVLRRVFALDEVDLPEALSQSIHVFPKLLSRDETVSESEIADACTRVAPVGGGELEVGNCIRIRGIGCQGTAIQSPARDIRRAGLPGNGVV